MIALAMGLKGAHCDCCDCSVEFVLSYRRVTCLYGHHWCQRGVGGDHLRRPPLNDLISTMILWLHYFWLYNWVHFSKINFDFITSSIFSIWIYNFVHFLENHLVGDITQSLKYEHVDKRTHSQMALSIPRVAKKGCLWHIASATDASEERRNLAFFKSDKCTEVSLIFLIL